MVAKKKVIDYPHISIESKEIIPKEVMYSIHKCPCINPLVSKCRHPLDITLTLEEGIKLEKSFKNSLIIKYPLMTSIFESVELTDHVITLNEYRMRFLYSSLTREFKDSTHIPHQYIPPGK